MIKREFSIKGVDFVVADYHPRKNEFEKGLKYQLLIKIYDNPYDDTDYRYMSTGFKANTIKEAKNIAFNEYASWL